MKGHPRCLTPPEDFVLVPENIPSDHSGILLEYDFLSEKM